MQRARALRYVGLRALARCTIRSARGTCSKNRSSSQASRGPKNRGRSAVANSDVEKSGYTVFRLGVYVLCRVSLKFEFISPMRVPAALSNHISNNIGQRVSVG